MTGTGDNHVAVVDDDESVCRSFARLLRMAGFNPMTYRSAEEFLDDRVRQRFGCLILDVQLEGMSGLDLRDRLARGKDRTPVVFITAQDEPEFRERAETGGCAGYFSKTDPGTLVLDVIEGIFLKKPSAE